MYQSGITRRQLLKALLLLGFSGAISKYWLVHAKDNTPIFHNFFVINKPSIASFEIFTALSVFVTLREDLDNEALKSMYKLFIAEPWGAEHMIGCYTKIFQYLNKTSSNKNFNEGEGWFLSHLLTTWYPGIYYHENFPSKRIIYEKSLLFDTIKDVLPIPFITNVEFASWQMPPEKMYE